MARSRPPATWPGSPAQGVEHELQRLPGPAVPALLLGGRVEQHREGLAVGLGRELARLGREPRRGRTRDPAKDLRLNPLREPGRPGLPPHPVPLGLDRVGHLGRAAPQGSLPGRPRVDPRAQGGPGQGQGRSQAEGQGGALGEASGAARSPGHGAPL